MHTKRLKKLINDLRHHDSSKRRNAAVALSEGDERAVYPLIRALRDENFGVQDAAMRSLMEIKGEHTAYMVLPLLREDSFLRNTALIIIKEIGKDAVPLLFPLLNDRDDDIRKFALDLIHDIQYCNYPEKLVEILKDDPNPNVRAAAAKAIGVLKYKEAIPQLKDSLKIKVDEEWVCFSVLEAITNLGDDSSIYSIIALLNCSSEAIRFAAIEALGKIGSPLASNYLIDRISRTGGIEKKAALKSLIQIGNIPSIPGLSNDLVEMLKDGDWEDQITAINGLVALKEKNAIYHMINLAGNFDTSVPDNEEKVFIIKKAVKSFGCNDSLIDILNDQSMRYRGRSIVIDIIGDLKCKKAVPHLIKLLNCSYKDVKQASATALGKIGGAEVKEPLIKAITDSDGHVRRSAIAALGKIGDITAFEPLMKLLQKEKYNDIIDELINALLHLNSRLFLSRLNEFNNNIQEITARHTSDLNLEVTC